MRPPSQRFRTLELYDPVPCHQVGLAYRTDRYQNLAAKEFALLCKETVDELRTQAKAIGSPK